MCAYSREDRVFISAHSTRARMVLSAAAASTIHSTADASRSKGLGNVTCVSAWRVGALPLPGNAMFQDLCTQQNTPTSGPSYHIKPVHPHQKGHSTFGSAVRIAQLQAAPMGPCSTNASCSVHPLEAPASLPGATPDGLQPAPNLQGQSCTPCTASGANHAHPAVPGVECRRR